MMRANRNTAICLADAIKNLDFATIGPGYRRGLVMSAWKAKVCKVTGRKDWHHDFERAWLTGQQADSDSAAYRHPTLVIKMAAGSMWIPELDMQRYRICWKLNERFEEEFLKQVRIK